MKYRSRLPALALALSAVGAPSWAHHSFAMFDLQKDLTLTGTVREFQWTNPHVWIQLNVATAGGATEEWGIEGTTPASLARKGWTRHSFQPGAKVVVTIHPLKSGEKGGAFVKAVFADGRTLSEVPGLGGNSSQAPAEKP